MHNFHDNPTALIVIGIVILIAMAVYFIPIVRIVQRTGHSGWWVLLALLPLGNIVGLWLLGFGRWPALENK